MNKHASRDSGVATGAFILNAHRCIVSALSFAVILVLLGGSLDNADRVGYEQNYEELGRGGMNLDFEPGYQLLAFVCSKLGAPYESFTLLISFLGLLLIGGTAKEFTGRPVMVLVLYGLYPLFWDYVQIRNFAAMSILVFGFRYILGAKKSVAKYLLAVCVASMFHAASIFFFTMAVALIERRRNFAFVYVAIGLATWFILGLVLSNPFTEYLVTKVDAYTTTETSSVTKFGVLVFYVGTLVSVYVSHAIIRRRAVCNRRGNGGLSECMDSSHRRFSCRLDSNVVLRVFLISGLWLPLVMLNMDFMRLYRNLFLVSVITLIVASDLAANFMGRFSLKAFVVVYAACCFIAFVHLMSFTDIVSPLLYSNFLLSKYISIG